MPLVPATEGGAPPAPAPAVSEVLPRCTGGGAAADDAEWRRRLTETQYLNLRKCATQPRGMTPEYGGYEGMHGAHPPGAQFHCVGCSAALYDAAAQFDCGCGWPGFWTSLPGAVYELADADGVRTMIKCNACHGHLGHVCRGEGWDRPPLSLPLDERHCVGSVCVALRAPGAAAPVAGLYNGPLYTRGHRPKGKAGDKFGTVYDGMMGGGRPPDALGAPVLRVGSGGAACDTRCWVVVTAGRGSRLLVAAWPAGAPPSLPDFRAALERELGLGAVGSVFSGDRELADADDISGCTYFDVRPPAP